ncbi:MAG TPA: exodeoxyribonuclease VII small subunit [Patescibacteria group bacterium]|nr:exodeoxyribonuclease VII small subunit [Patescibacteria group bacterium]
MAKKASADYQSLSQELDNVLAALQQPDVQVDEAVKLYQKGLELAAALEATLKTAENTITQLKLQANAGDA